MSTKSWVDKEAVVYIHNGILLSHRKNASESVLTHHTEWSESERDKWTMCINADMESRKMVVTNVSAGQLWGCRQLNRLGDTVREGGANGESSVETHTHRVWNSQPAGFAIWHRALRPGCSVTAWRAGRREGGGREAGGRGHTDTCGWLTRMYGRDPDSIVKQLASNYN